MRALLHLSLNRNRWLAGSAAVSDRAVLYPTRPGHSRISLCKHEETITYLILNHIPLQELARRVPVRTLRDLGVEDASLILDEVVSRGFSVDGEVGRLAALAHLMTLLLHGSDIVGAAACLDGAFGEEGRVWVGVAAGVGW